MRLVGILTLLQAVAVFSLDNISQVQDQVEQDFPDGDTSDNNDDKETSWTNNSTVLDCRHQHNINSLSFYQVLSLLFMKCF